MVVSLTYNFERLRVKSSLAKCKTGDHQPNKRGLGTGRGGDTRLLTQKKELPSPAPLCTDVPLRVCAATLD